METNNAWAVAATFLTLTMPAIAQDPHAGHVAMSSTTDMALVAKLPEICMTAPSDPGATSMAMSHEMDPAHAGLMAGMDENTVLMMQAGMVEDIDVAFVCAMIPHHWSAINMAKAELEHGDNTWAKDLAQKIIDAQEAEIAEMVEWLESEEAGE